MNTEVYGMRRMAGAAIALAFVLLPSAASATGPTSRQQGGTVQFAQGVGGDTRQNHWAFLAASSPSGDVQGAAWFQPPDVPSMGISAFTVFGLVTCLMVNGNEATIGINVEAGTGTAAPFVHTGGLYMFAWDGDSPGMQDEFSNTWWTDSPPTDCTIAVPDTGFPLAFGRVEVRNAA